MLQFKKDYDKHDIEILVDNTSTHTTKEFNLYDFDKSIRIACLVKVIDCTDENHQQQQLQCYFQNYPKKTEAKVYWLLPMS